MKLMMKGGLVSQSYTCIDDVKVSNAVICLLSPKRNWLILSICHLGLSYMMPTYIMSHVSCMQGTC